MQGDVTEVMFAVRSDLVRNLGNITSRWGPVTGSSSCGARPFFRCSSAPACPWVPSPSGGGGPSAAAWRLATPVTAPARPALPCPQRAARALPRCAGPDPGVHPAGAGRAAVHHHRPRCAFVFLAQFVPSWAAPAADGGGVLRRRGCGHGLQGAGAGHAPRHHQFHAAPHVPPAAGVPLDEKIAFLRETRHAFGRTALVLSGGGSFGSFHMVCAWALGERSGVEGSGSCK